MTDGGRAGGRRGGFGRSLRACVHPQKSDGMKSNRPGHLVNGAKEVDFPVGRTGDSVKTWQAQVSLTDVRPYTARSLPKNV